MPSSRPDKKMLLGKDAHEVPMSLQRIVSATEQGERLWIGPKEAAVLSKDDKKAYDLAHTVMAHLCVRAPTLHSSGHPGGPLSSFTFAYFLSARRD